MVGHYLANFPERDTNSDAAKANESLDVFADGKYKHIYRIGSGEAAQNEGTWTKVFKSKNSGIVMNWLELSDWPERGSFRAEIKQNMLNRRISLVIDEDHDRRFF